LGNAEGILLDETFLLASLIIFIGCFTQGLTGFGLGLVTMALLPVIIGLRQATPLVALVGIVLELIMMIRYREAFQFKSIWPLLAACVIGIPIGVFYLIRVDETITLFALGVVTFSYALYALIGFRLPKLSHSIWVWIFGILGGVLGGAYNTGGPPVILYGNCRRWSPDEFKGKLASFFLVGSLMAGIAHWVSGNITPNVFSLFASTLPALILGYLLSQFMDRWLNPETFRKVVLVLLVFLGINLIV
jgi:uncharacterized membrane protein YfcA